MLRLAPFALLGAPAFADANDITVDAGRGPITVHVPDSYEEGTPAPLVVLLHLSLINIYEPTRRYAM